MRLICWLMEWWYTCRYMDVISGHEYVEQPDGTLKCERCGKVSA
jgi:hypothetical protein